MINVSPYMGNFVHFVFLLHLFMTCTVAELHRDVVLRGGLSNYVRRHLCVFQRTPFRLKVLGGYKL